jgi:hypothetical protein
LQDATKVVINKINGDGSTAKVIDSIYFDSPDTALINKMLSQDPAVSINAALWNESKAINYEIKVKEGKWNKLLKLTHEKDI